MAVYLYLMLKIMIKIYAALQNSAYITSKDTNIKIPIPSPIIQCFLPRNLLQNLQPYYIKYVSLGKSVFSEKYNHKNAVTHRFSDIISLFLTSTLPSRRGLFEETYRKELSIPPRKRQAAVLDLLLKSPGYTTRRLFFSAKP